MSSPRPLVARRAAAPGGVAVAALGALVATSGCSSTAYTRAAKPYAAAVAQGTVAFIGELEAASVACRERAELDEVRHLMEGSMADPQVARDWSAHCEEVAAAAEAQRQAASLLGAYAQALDQLADGAAYEGAGVEEAAKGASTLIERLAGRSTPEATYVSALGAPLTQLAGFLLTQAASQEIKHLVAQSAAPVEAILAAMTAYLEASQVQRSVHEHQAMKLLADAEARLRVDASGGATRKVPPLEAFALVERASQTRARFVAAQRRERALASAVAGLLAAEQGLKRAGERDEAELKVVADDAARAGKVLKDLLEVHPREWP